MSKYNRFSAIEENNNDDNHDSSLGEILNTVKWRNINTNTTGSNGFNSFRKKTYQKQNSINEKENKKTLLCYNMLLNGECNYGNTCKYAHSLHEQIIEKTRKPIFDILISKSDLSHINFQENVNLYRGLLLMTKICDKDNCPGGYNCRNGACKNTHFYVCENDLTYGNCKNKNCTGLHLTERGLKPFWSIDDKTNVSTNMSDNIKGTLLSERFWNLHTNVSKLNDSDSDLSMDSTSSDKSSVSSKEYEESIFTTF